MQVLAIETSCDETAVAVVNDQKEILFEQLWTQDHSTYGGVIPEVASRNHLYTLENMLAAALKNSDFTHIAVTGGPGLIGGVMVGVMMAKALASATKKPFLAINHLEGHVLSPRFNNSLTFPFLALLISGGHCQMIIAKGVGQYEVLGKTLDDALGETFDKVGRMLDLPYPGGPKIEELAKQGDEKRFSLVRPLYRRPGCDFSFSGLKTAMRQLINELGELSMQDKCDICASFQRVISEVLIDRLAHAVTLFKRSYHNLHFTIVGGVAANCYLREKLQNYLQTQGMQLFLPDNKLCTDNAVMIAWAAIEQLFNGMQNTPLNFSPKARWPLSDL